MNGATQTYLLTCILIVQQRGLHWLDEGAGFLRGMQLRMLYPCITHAQALCGLMGLPPAMQTNIQLKGIASEHGDCDHILIS